MKEVSQIFVFQIKTYNTTFTILFHRFKYVLIIRVVLKNIEKYHHDLYYFPTNYIYLFLTWVVAKARETGAVFWYEPNSWLCGTCNKDLYRKFQEIQGWPWCTSFCCTRSLDTTNRKLKNRKRIRVLTKYFMFVCIVKLPVLVAIISDDVLFRSKRYRVVHVWWFLFLNGQNSNF